MPLVRISVLEEMAAERRLMIAAAVYDSMRLTLNRMVVNGIEEAKAPPIIGS
jgi:hypothetical protein